MVRFFFGERLFLLLFPPRVTLILRDFRLPYPICTLFTFVRLRLRFAVELGMAEWEFNGARSEGKPSCVSMINLEAFYESEELKLLDGPCTPKKTCFQSED